MKPYYFAVLGRMKGLSLYELETMGATIIQNNSDHVVFTIENDALREAGSKHLGGVTKWGSCVACTNQEMPTALLEQRCADTKLVGVNDKALGLYCKKSLGVKRFKEISLQNTDQEVKEQGVELVRLGGSFLGRVSHYQPIPLYEAIDFDKPVRGMQIGMMPAKLTQTLMSIALSGVRAMNPDQQKPITVWDPFCGFGTTGFLANTYGFNFIGSDINPTPTKQNLPRRKQQSFATNNHFTVFKHDVTQSFTQPFLQHVSCIVTEGWLGPVMSTKAVNQLTRQQLNERREAIASVYSGFLDALADASPKSLSSLPIVITYPQRTFTDENLSVSFIKKAQEMGYTVEQVGDVYTRKGQNVGRRILYLYATPSK